MENANEFYKEEAIAFVTWGDESMSDLTYSSVLTDRGIVTEVARKSYSEIYVTKGGVTTLLWEGYLTTQWGEPHWENFFTLGGEEVEAYWGLVPLISEYGLDAVLEALESAKRALSKESVFLEGDTLPIRGEGWSFQTT